MISVLKRHLFTLYLHLSISAALSLQTSRSTSQHTAIIISHNFTLQFVSLVPANLLWFLPQMSELLQEKCKFLFLNGFVPPLKFHLIYFVTEQSKREISVTFPHIPPVKGRKWEVLEILIPTLSPFPPFCTGDWPNSLSYAGIFREKGQYFRRR